MSAQEPIKAEWAAGSETEAQRQSLFLLPAALLAGLLVMGLMAAAAAAKVGHAVAPALVPAAG